MSVPREGRTARRRRDEFDDSTTAKGADFDTTGDLFGTHKKPEPCVVCHDMKDLLDRSKQLNKQSGVPIFLLQSFII